MREHLEHRLLDPAILNRPYGWCADAGEVVPDDQANLVSSRLKEEHQIGKRYGFPEDLHYILLDLDGIQAEIVPSSTPGNSHLYIYHAVESDELDRLVTLLEEIGLIEPGIKRGWKERGILCLRKPGVRKTFNAVKE